MSSAEVVAVCRATGHGMSKPVQDRIRLLAGLGVEDDAHAGVTVKHRARVKRDPTTLNLRQVHLLQGELFDELRDAGFDLSPGMIGENITTKGIDLLDLPAGARLRLGDAAEVEITGLRNPCYQLDDLMPGLMKATLGRDAQGGLIRKAGVMAVVRTGGEVRAGDAIEIALPTEPRRPLEPV